MLLWDYQDKIVYSFVLPRKRGTSIKENTMNCIFTTDISLIYTVNVYWKKLKYFFLSLILAWNLKLTVKTKTMAVALPNIDKLNTNSYWLRSEYSLVFEGNLKCSGTRKLNLSLSANDLDSRAPLSKLNLRRSQYSAFSSWHHFCSRTSYEITRVLLWARLTDLGKLLESWGSFF